MKSITEFIEGNLLLKVNLAKSSIARPTDIKYLEFGFYNEFKSKQYKAKAHPKSVAKIIWKLRVLTSRKWGVSNKVKAQKIDEVIRGWINYFKIGSLLAVARKIDAMVRYRFRMCIWKHWKTIHNRYKNLLKLGVNEKNVACAACAHGYARICRTETICFAISNKRLAKFGLISAEEYLKKVSC